MFAPALYLGVLLLLLSRSSQAWLQRQTFEKPVLIFVAPVLLSAGFCAAAKHYDCLTWRLILLVLVYTFVPTACVYAQTRFGRVSTASSLDFAVILMLWLPLEFSVGGALIPRPVQGVLHATAYGMAVTLGVLLFLIARRWRGTRYTLPCSFLDAGNVLLGFIASALLLIPLGLWIGFLAHPHSAQVALRSAAFRIVLIFFGTAFPEEILFRTLIQNWFTQRLQQPSKAVLVSSLIFGASHLNNAPGPLPNWRYMAVATIAGIIFGTVFLRSTSVFASTTVHTAVNTTKYLFF
jgi:membrane protease YdiL (CAAX protease family)